MHPLVAIPLAVYLAIVATALVWMLVARPPRTPLQIVIWLFAGLLWPVMIQQARKAEQRAKR